jgi:molecular chaperone GrpE
MQPEEASLNNLRSHHPGKPPILSLLQADVLPLAPFDVPVHPDVAETTIDVQSLIAEMWRLRRCLEEKTEQEAVYECLVKSLSKEVQQYREGIYFKLLQPLFLDLINMYHDLGRLIDDTTKKGMNNTVRLMIENIESFQETIEETLHHYGIETFYVEGNTFLASKQRVVRVIKTADRRLDKQIARRVRKGFKYEGKVLSPEVVVVYKAEPEV